MDRLAAGFAGSVRESRAKVGGREFGNIGDVDRPAGAVNEGRERQRGVPTRFDGLEAFEAA